MCVRVYVHDYVMVCVVHITKKKVISVRHDDGHWFVLIIAVKIIDSKDEWEKAGY